SLAPRSPDEMVSVDLLLGHVKGESRPDVVVSIVDATNLGRHLYLTTQLLELGVPVVLAVNLVDIARSHGLAINFARLEERLGIPVVPVQANKGIGLESLKKAIAVAADLNTPPARVVTFPDPLRRGTEALGDTLGADGEPFLAARPLLAGGGHEEKQLAGRFGPELVRQVAEARARLTAAGCPVPAVEARSRYAWIREAVAGCITRPAQRPVTWTDRL